MMSSRGRAGALRVGKHLWRSSSRQGGPPCTGTPAPRYPVSLKEAHCLVSSALKRVGGGSAVSVTSGVPLSSTFRSPSADRQHGLGWGGQSARGSPASSQTAFEDGHQCALHLRPPGVGIGPPRGHEPFRSCVEMLDLDDLQRASAQKRRGRLRLRPCPRGLSVQHTHRVPGCPNSPPASPAQPGHTLRSTRDSLGGK